MEELKEDTNMTDNENVPLVKKKRVINAPRSEKQIEAFKKPQQKRDKNREKMKKKKKLRWHKFILKTNLKKMKKNNKNKKKNHPPKSQL